MEQNDYSFSEPLAHSSRPNSLNDFVGHYDVVGQGKTLRKLIENDTLHNMIFWGPPGVGKTTLARIIANKTKSDFIAISAVTAGVADIRKIIEKAQETLRFGGKTILFIDEIHRFNKTQQDALLPHTEQGTIILIGATTENPSFEVNAALLSRSQVFVFKSLSDKDLESIIEKILSKHNKKKLKEAAKKIIVKSANGDARKLINNLELILKTSIKDIIDQEEAKNILQKKFLRYDKKGEEHYNIISALHKSLRDSDPDGALYWMFRMLEAGEDPKFVARRLIRFASEDIGMADPHALLVAIAAKEAVIFNGMPECEINLAQACIHLAMSPKSNSLYSATDQIKNTIANTGNLEVPIHLRNAPTKLMKNLGYGKGYKYAHNFKNAKIDQKHLPNEIQNQKFYHPSDRGIEAKIKQKIDKERSI